MRTLDNTIKERFATQRDEILSELHGFCQESTRGFLYTQAAVSLGAPPCWGLGPLSTRTRVT